MTTSAAPSQRVGTSPIDKAYDARHSVDAATFTASLERWASLSAECRATVPCHLDLCYDESSGQKLDLFCDPVRRGQPVFLFVHGGYWRMSSKNDASFMAANFARFGVATVAIDYPLVPAATLETIIDQVRASLVWLFRHAEHYGLDPERIVVSGSSAGGHLAAALLADNYRSTAGMPVSCPHGAVLISGLYDMQPVRESFVNDWLQLDHARAAATSPIRTLTDHPVPLAIVHGEHEPVGFKEQADLFARHCHTRWPDSAGNVEAFEVPDRHHFDVLLDLADPASRLTKTTLALLGVST